MAFRVEPVKELYLLDTSVENIFINEFMTAAPGDYVKVYLLSLMYANSGTVTDNAGIAKQLSLEEEDVLKAWSYWENLGVIRKNHRDVKDRFHYDVEFLCIKEQLYGKKSKEKGAGGIKSTNLINDTELKNLYKSIEHIIGRPLGGTEPTEIISWIEDYGISPEVVIYAYSYCVKNKKKDNNKYIGAVIKGWADKQLDDAQKIENYLQEVDKRFFLYKRVLKAMGFTRNATETEKSMMDVWFDKMGVSIEKVLEACGKTTGISNPNFNYVNSILKNWYTEETGGKKTGDGKKVISVADVYRFYDIIRKQAEDDANMRREEIYSKIPEIKAIDEELRLDAMEMSKVMISGNTDKKRQTAKYQSKVDELTAQKAGLLAENGYDADYMKTKYRCEICRDSGISDDDERCSCFKEVEREAELWQTSSKS